MKILYKKPRFWLCTSFIVFLIIILWSICNGLLIRNRYDKKFETEIELQSSYREQLLEFDSLSSTNISALDSSLNILRRNQLMLFDRQVDLINDVRQETNNMIDKLNLWLTFAIGMFSIIGVFLPLWGQYVKTKEYEKEFKRLSRDFRNKKNEIVENIEKELEIRRKEIDQFKRDSNDMIQLIESASRIQELRSRFLSLSIGYEDKILNNQPEREQIYRTLWSKAVDSFNGIIEWSFDENSDCEIRRIYLIESFILLNTFILKLKNSDTASRPRKWTKILDDIRSLLLELEYTHDNNHIWLLIRDQIKYFQTDLNKLHLPE